MPQNLLIVGASVRAAAFSAVEAGFDPVGIDLFADLDLAACCPAFRVDPGAYPGGVPGIAAGLPDGPWMYTGALENHPDVVDRLASNRPLWGNPGEVLRRVRDPMILASRLQQVGLPSLEARPDAGGLPRDGSWLVKPLRSAGGSRIRALDGAGPGPEPGAEYLQRRAIGPSGSAVFVAQGGKASLRGITRQWVGHDGEPFGYLGSVGPVRVPDRARRQLLGIGALLASEEGFGLKGLFGVDFVLSGGVAWPTEVNPRYTASVEVLEYATGRSLLFEHARAFEDVPGDGRHSTCEDRRDRRVGKIIAYAPVDGRVPPSSGLLGFGPRAGHFPRVADLGPPGTAFRAGQPVQTLLDRGPTAASCRRRLISRLRAVRDQIRRRAAEAGGP